MWHRFMDIRSEIVDFVLLHGLLIFYFVIYIEKSDLLPGLIEVQRHSKPKYVRTK